jgi:hypothetical protein
MYNKIIIFLILVEECNKEEYVATAGAATTPCLKRIL